MNPGDLVTIRRPDGLETLARVVHVTPRGQVLVDHGRRARWFRPDGIAVGSMDTITGRQPTRERR